MTSTIKKYWFKTGVLHEFEVVNLKELYTKSFNELIVPHRTEFYQIIWFKKGSPKHMVDFNPVDIKPNSILFVDKNSVQCFDSSEPIEGEVLMFSDNFFCKTEVDTKFLRSCMLFNDLHAVSNIEMTGGLSKTFNSFFQLIKTELKTNADSFQSDILRNYLQNLLLVAERTRLNIKTTTINKGPDLEYVIKFRDLLDRQFHVLKSVSKYCLQLRVTEKRLNAATLKIMAITPKQMIDSRIILEAKRLLAHTTDSVKEIAYTLGFEEPTNFVKYFKKHQKVTPLEFRNRFK
ncbi:helix-turn-helix domain-containing protein [Formosa sediminum]|uniref:Helix-turn-helix domain-containing protein n=1 Tax=Formosa sediminum TaxID=2594004 RepID=A0A516GTS3_9FLAO|nr:helix-turn-helix transcriptional regulator [Formosa sediminum]QDO94926.1 helix-turn-helix domain-containing protein [Formosa sediminum]